MSQVSVTLNGGSQFACDEGTRVGELPGLPPAAPSRPWIAALVNNDVSSLSYPLTVNSQVQLLTPADSHGWHVYRRSLCFLLGKVVRELFPGAAFAIEHSFGQGLYCTFRSAAGSSNGMRGADLDHIRATMRALVARDVPIERRKIAFADAVALFEQAGLHEKLSLLKYRNSPRIVIHCCEGFFDLAHGPLAPSTGVLRCFELTAYGPGFVLNLPTRERPDTIEPLGDQAHLFRIFQEHKEWGRTVGVTTVGRLNEIVAAGDIEAFMWAAEALHEKKIARIADLIAERRDHLRLILVAGPSSAGKTTFAKRLSSHLMANGLRPVTLATDDYFVGPELNPKDEDGNPDYEHIEAVDLPLLNDHLRRLTAGEAVDRPFYNFGKRRREFRGAMLRVEKDQILMIEGIHALNPTLTAAVSADCKFSIYVSALTQLNVDANNRISTTDNRLMRRMVRDHKYRGHSALATLKTWPSVRRGEKRWIFPFQRQANVAFNSALDYELAVLKPLVEPLLMQIKPYDPEYAEARRLSEFLLNFLAVQPFAVPRSSILREYIGGSMLHY